MPDAPICRSCGSKEMERVGPCAPFDRLPVDLVAEPGSLWRCRTCALGQRHPCLQGETLVEAYRNTPDSAMDYRFEENGAWIAARDFLSERWSNGEPRRVLDVGCHTGAFLSGLPSGWSRFGIESAEAPIRTALANGIAIVADRIETVDRRWDGSFDAVTLFDVVEHLPDPAQGLLRAAELLRPDGLLLVSTADMDAWTWRLAKGRHWYLQSALHVCVGSEAFFRYVSGRGRLRLAQSCRIPHRRGDSSMRWRECCEAVYWEMRQRGGIYRIPQRLMHSLPGLQKLKHRQSTPWTMHLSDHVFLVMSRLPAA